MSTNQKEQKQVIHRWGGKRIILGLMTALLLAITAVGVLAANVPAGNESNEPAGRAQQQAQQAWELINIPAAAQTVTLLPAEARGRLANPKLDSSLAELVAAGSPAEINTLADRSGLRLADDRVQVQITIDPSRAKDARQVVTTTGGQITKSSDDGSVLQAWLPPDTLASVAAAEAVLYVRQPAYAIEIEEATVSAALTEGVAAAGAPVWHSAGLTGQGVKVAIIDAGFLDYPDLLGGDLPAAVTAKTFVDFQNDSYVNKVTPHGTACAEIIHDMAPNAQLYLLQVATHIDLGEAVDYAIAQDVDVISTSLGFLNATPGDGTGYFAEEADKTRAAGILWVTAAGNYRETHWGGAFNDTGDGTHAFADGQNVNFFGPGNNQAFLIPGGRTIRVYIRWDDWQAVNQDYDLHLVRWTGSGYSLVASSTNLQGGQFGQRPVEQISYVTAGSASVYGFVVERVNSGRAVNLEIFSASPPNQPNLSLDERVNARSLANLADVGGVLTVAALHVNAPYPQENYSSEGPTNGPGGVQNGGGLKPDIAAYANVSTSTYGPGGFIGTSSAAPHVAGAAALVESAHPSYSPDQVQSFLQSRAADLGTPGPDTLFGYGRLLLNEQNFIPVLLR
jgi:subtilisin family serine protease